MGVKGFLRVLDNNLPTICGPTVSIQGRLVIDGANLLHWIYQEHEIVLEFFGNLQSAGVRPIVVMDGAGGIESYIEDVVYRRNRTIGDIAEDIRRHTLLREERKHGTSYLSYLGIHLYT
jgi:hypothetical protein